jgi:hypothetical protein
MKGGFTGAIANIKCSDQGPKIGFRFDIDGLPIQESNEQSHAPQRKGFKSKNENMHACAHDGHIAVGLGLAKKIKENEKLLTGNYYFIFQPSEEGPSGGKVFSKIETIHGLDYIIPIHIGIINERKIVCGLSFMALKWVKVVYEGINKIRMLRLVQKVGEMHCWRHVMRLITYMAYRGIVKGHPELILVIFIQRVQRMSYRIMPNSHWKLEVKMIWFAIIYMKERWKY